MMKQSGHDFHPDLLINFFSALGIYPPGTLVELNTMETALVIKRNISNIHRPQVQILYNSLGEKYKHPILMNLMTRDQKGNFECSILRSVKSEEKSSTAEEFIQQLG